MGFGFGFDTDRAKLGFADRESVYPTVAGAGDRIHTLWFQPSGGLSSQTFVDGGRTATAESSISGCLSLCLTRSWRIAAAGTHVWATWVQVETIDNFPRYQVWLRVSDDSGDSWGPRQRLSDGSSTAWFPEIAAAGDRAHVIWFDGGGLRIRTIEGATPRAQTHVVTASALLNSAKVAATVQVPGGVTVAWEASDVLHVATSLDAGTTFPVTEVWPDLELDGLAMTPTRVHIVASDRPTRPVLLLSSPLGGSYSTTDLAGPQDCAAGCSSSDLAALDDLVAVAFHNAGGVFVTRKGPLGASTSSVGAAPQDSGYARVALTPTATSVVWQVRPAVTGDEGYSLVGAGANHGGGWSSLSPHDFWGTTPDPNAVVPTIAGVGSGFGIAYMAFDGARGDFQSNTALQPTYLHADGGEPNLEIVEAKTTQGVDSAKLIPGKATTIVAQVRNTTGKARMVRIAVTTANDGVAAPTVTLTRSIEPGTSVVLLPGSEAPLRPVGPTEFTWALKLDSDEQFTEIDEIDNTYAGTETDLAAPAANLRVVFVPVRIGASTAPTCGGATAPERQVESVRYGREIGDAVLPFDERATSWSISCSGLAYPGPKVSAREVLHDLHSLAFGGQPTKMVGVVKDGFFKDLQDDPSLSNAIGLSFVPTGSGFYRCLDGIIVENGVAAGADKGLLNGTAVTHEILHSAGFNHTASLPAPGTWVREGRRIPSSYVDLLDKNVQPDPWIAASTFAAVRATVLQGGPGCDGQPPGLASGRVAQAAAAAVTPGPTLALDGRIDAAGTVVANTFYERVTEPDVSLGGAGPIEARFLDGLGATIGSAGFATSGAVSEGEGTPPPPGVGSFGVRVPVPAGSERVQLYRDGVMRFERTKSAAAPTITVGAPNGGERFVAGDEITVTWTSADGDGDTRHHLVAVSTDDGATWTALGADVSGSSFAFTATDSMVSDDVRVRVDVSDGWRTASDTSATFAIVPRTSAGRIAYVTGAGALMTIDPDGSDPLTLRPASPAAASSPAWSPDGTRIAFAILNQGIWVIDADGANPHQIVAPAACLGGMRYPDWSPDGARIVFVNTDCAIKTMRVNADGTGLADLGIAGDDPAWSPAGDRIAISYQNPLVPGSTLTYIDPDDGHILSSVQLNETGGGVDWSPDASRIAYTGSFGNPFVWTADPDGTNRTRLGPPPPYPNGVPAYQGGPHWSPAGDRIVFWQEPESSQLILHELWTENADGTGAVQVTHDGNAVREYEPDWQPRPAPRDSIVADAGGPYSGPEGSAIGLTAAASTATASIVGRAWDLDSDGAFDDATGVAPSLTPADDGVVQVAVRVIDSNGQAGVAGAAVTVTNVSPVVTFASPGSVDADGQASLAARIADPGEDEQTVTVNWNDGSAPEIVPFLARATGGGDILALHDYAAAGPHTATVHADDGDGGTGQATTGFAMRAANTPPTVGDGTAQTVTGQPVLVTVATADADGDTVRLAVQSGPSHGAAEVIDADDGALERRLVYTPAGGFVGGDTFTATGRDSRGAVATATITVTVAPLPGAAPPPLPGAAPPPSPLAPGPPATVPITPPAPARRISPDAACANDRLQLIDVYPDGRRVRIHGVAPAATRGQPVAIVFAATGKKVASAVVAADLSFTTTAPLPPRRLRGSDRARYVAVIGRLRSGAIKLARRMFLRSVTRSGTSVTVTGQVVKPLATKATDRRIAVIIATNCRQAAGIRRRRVTFAPGPSGRFKRTIKLTTTEVAAQAVYLRAQTKVRAGARSKRIVRTFTLMRGVALR